MGWSPMYRVLQKRHAEEYCQKNGLGYCEVTGELVAEIPCDENYKAQWDKMIDYHAINYNWKWKNNLELFKKHLNEGAMYEAYFKQCIYL